MKSSLHKLSLFAVITCALALAPASGLAQEKKSETATEKKPENPNRILPFHGTVDAVDKNAKTVKVGERVFHVTSDTHIKKDEKPGTLNDATVGEAIRGSYRKAEDGKLNAVSLSFGAKPAEGEKSAAPVEKPAKKQPKSAE